MLPLLLILAQLLVGVGLDDEMLWFLLLLLVRRPSETGYYYHTLLRLYTRSHTNSTTSLLSWRQAQSHPANA
uniref:Putative secreted peptide n=1 Tax=Anopheles braziliensis TaxID=58242 RepID=A0A2M3ZTQ9_9DIPT